MDSVVLWFEQLIIQMICLCSSSNITFESLFPTSRQFVVINAVLYVKINRQNVRDVGSVCGAVGKVVSSDTGDSQFESSHQQFYLLSTVLKPVFKRPK